MSITIYCARRAHEDISSVINFLVRKLSNLLQDNLSEADVDEYDEQMLQFDKEINQKLERLSTLTDKYEEKYDMHFIDPIY